MNAEGRMEIIRELCSFRGRLAGTDAERRAANRLAERLRESGRRAEVEPTYVHPQYPLVQAVHCLLGFAGSLVAIEVPALGFGLVLAAATSMYLDLNYRLYIVRSLFFRRSSQNVVSPGLNPGAPARLIICAHLDAGRSGAVFSPGRRWAALLNKRYPWLGPLRVLFWSLAVLLPLLGARMAGVESVALSLLQLLPTLVLLIGIYVLIEVQLSDVVLGANDNASGVATAISLAAELDAEPASNLDVWVVLDGAEQTLQEGMRAFIRSRRKQLDRAATFFIAIDSVGRGDVRFETTAGWVVSYAMDRRLVALAAAIAESDAAADKRFRAQPWRRATAGESMPPRVAGFRAIGITCGDTDGATPDSPLPADRPEALDPGSLDRAHGFALELVRRLDRDLGRAPIPAPSPQGIPAMVTREPGNA